MSATFTARYAGRCARCQGEITPGQTIQQLSAERFAHPDCVAPQATKSTTESTTESTTPPATLIQVQNCLGNWSEPRELETLTHWSQPVTLTAAQLDTLRTGREVRYGDEWYSCMRVPRAKPRPVPVPTPRFTCPRCGEHRDTTLRGHCDDCEA